MNLVSLLTAGVTVALVGILLQLHHSRLLFHDYGLIRRKGGSAYALELIQFRIGLASILATIHLLVASTGVAHLLTHSPLIPVNADYWAAIVRNLVSILVILSTGLSLALRRRLLAVPG